MSSPENTDRPPSVAQDGQGVLANLPRTRPQRSTPRRAAARRATGAEQAAAGAPSVNGAGPAEGARTAGSTAAAGAKRADVTPSPRTPRAAKGASGAKGRTTSKTLKSAAAKPAAAAARPRRAPAKASTGREPVPRQGFASDGERVSGPVAPPGGAEFLATAAEIVNELARAGLSSGERLFKDVLSRLPLS
jgi:hypothetical protein